jgi:hypothetical protein
MFMGLQLYRHLTPRPSLEQYRQDDGGIRINRDQAQHYLKDEIDAMSLDIAKSTLSGAIIQVAYSGISQHSTETKIPKELHIATDRRKAKFCIGRDVHGLPLGLVIYAARIQYNHWEEGMPKNQTAKYVFTHLASVRMNDPWHDLVYELDWPVTRPVTHHILELELQWHKYEDYLSDMKQMLHL